MIEKFNERRTGWRRELGSPGIRRLGVGIKTAIGLRLAVWSPVRGPGASRKALGDHSNQRRSRSPVRRPGAGVAVLVCIITSGSEQVRTWALRLSSEGSVFLVSVGDSRRLWPSLVRGAACGPLPQRPGRTLARSRRTQARGRLPRCHRGHSGSTVLIIRRPEL